MLQLMFIYLEVNAKFLQGSWKGYAEESAEHG
jgi:hypothetical protein